MKTQNSVMHALAASYCIMTSHYVLNARPKQGRTTV